MLVKLVHILHQSLVEIAGTCMFQVQEIRPDELVVTFLRRKPEGNYYCFPGIDDISLVPTSDATMIRDPTFNARGHYFF